MSASRSDTIKVNFYLQGEITPLENDYDMSADGILITARRNRTLDGKSMRVILERGFEVPTTEQREAMRNIRTLNQTWELAFFFSEQVRPGKVVKRQVHLSSEPSRKSLVDGLRSQRKTFRLPLPTGRVEIIDPARVPSRAGSFFISVSNLD